MKYIATLCLSLLLACWKPSTTVDYPKNVFGPTAQIVIYREDVFVNSGALCRIFLDGREIASIRRSDRLEFNVPPGVHSIGCEGRTLTIVCEPDATYFVSVFPLMRLYTREESFKRLSETIRIQP